MRPKSRTPKRENGCTPDSDNVPTRASQLRSSMRATSSKIEAVGHLPRPRVKKCKASDTFNHGNGHPSKTNSKGSSSKDADKIDLGSAIASVLEEFGTIGSYPAEEPQLLRTTNANLTYINIHSNPEPTTLPRSNLANGPTEENLKNMSTSKTVLVQTVIPTTQVKSLTT